MNKVDDTLVSLLERISHILRFFMWNTAKNEKLSPVQMQILIFISNNKSSNNRTSVIAREFDLTKATVSDAIGSLKDKELIKIVRDEEDKRSHILELTADGKNTVEKISHWSDGLREEIGRFPAGTKEQVMMFLMEMLKSMQGSGKIDTARMCITCGNFQKNEDPSTSKPFRCNLTGEDMSEEEFNYGCLYYERGGVS